MDQNIDFSGFDQIQTPQYPEIHPPSQEIRDEYAQTEDSNELFQKLLEDLQIINKELKKCNHPTFSNDNKDHSAQHKEYSENSSNEIAASNSNQEKEGPPQDSDIHQLIREECCVEVSEEQKQKMEDTILELEVKNVVDQPAEDSTQPEYSPSMGYENPNTTPKMELDKIIKSGVEELVPILSENEVTSEDKKGCDM
nr:hypothetical protein [Tanacetum cinerariifolium]